MLHHLNLTVPQDPSTTGLIPVVPGTSPPTPLTTSSIVIPVPTPRSIRATWAGCLRRWTFRLQKWPWTALRCWRFRSTERCRCFAGWGFHLRGARCRGRILNISHTHIIILLSLITPPQFNIGPKNGYHQSENHVLNPIKWWVPCQNLLAVSSLSSLFMSLIFHNSQQAIPANSMHHLLSLTYYLTFTNI